MATLADPALTTLDQIRACRAALPKTVRRTPILPLARESAEVGRERLFLKAENLQVTGAYKPRAAFAVLQSLSPEERRRGLVMTSSGNFAQAFAYAGNAMGVPIVVVMMDRASPVKVAQTRGYGAEVVFSGNDPLGRQPMVERIAAERGMAHVDSWEHPAIAAGHGSIGLEIVEDAPEVEQVLVPVSSGGMAAGIATAIKEMRPDVKVIGVQPEGANAAFLSMKAGQPTTINHWHSMADGLSAVRPGSHPFRHLQRYMDEIVLISEQDIADTFRVLLNRAKILTEPAGAVAAAGFLAGKVDQTKRTVAMVSGGNVTDEMMATLLAMSAAGK